MLAVGLGIGAAVAHDMIGPLGQDRFISHVADEMSEIVVVDQFRIAENTRLLPE